MRYTEEIKKFNDNMDTISELDIKNAKPGFTFGEMLAELVDSHIPDNAQVSIPEKGVIHFEYSSRDEDTVEEPEDKCYTYPDDPEALEVINEVEKYTSYNRPLPFVDENCSDEYKNELGNYYYGYGYTGNNGNIDAVRDASADFLTELGGFTTPSGKVIQASRRMLYPNQYDLIQEVRHHNMDVVEACTELFRRTLTGIMEYNTQVATLAMSATNKATMCIIVERENDK